MTGLAEDRTFYSFDTNRELTGILRPDSASIDFAYDSAGRVDEVTISRGTLDYAYNDSTGQLTGITAPGSESLAFSYDGVLPISETWSGTVSGTVAFGYDADLRLSGLAVDGDTIAYGYDQDGLLTSAGDLTLVRDSLNGLLRETALDSVTTRTAYNAFGEPAADSAWVGDSLVFARTYSRDDLGRITEVVDVADGLTTIWGYGYDEVGRLETVTQDSVAFASYSYDANGNRLTRTSSSGTEVGVYDAQDRLTSYDGATHEYTPAGELARRIEGADTTRYEYDALGNLVEVELPDGTLVEYVIDGRNRRVGRSVDGQLVQGWLYGDPLNPVAELDSLGNVVSRFVYGSKANVPDYVIQGSDTLRVISDHLGSVRLVVDASSGVVAQRVSYDAWGRVLVDTNPGLQPFGFAGGITDPLTGLVRFGARDYDVVAGRWTAKDPIGFRGRDSNLQAYSSLDPVNLRDSTGRCPWCIGAGLVIGGLYGGVSGMANSYRDTGSVDPWRVLRNAAVGLAAGGLGGATATLLGVRAIVAGAGAGFAGGTGVDLLRQLDQAVPCRAFDPDLRSLALSGAVGLTAGAVGGLAGAGSLISIGAAGLTRTAQTAGTIIAGSVTGTAALTADAIIGRTP